MKYKELSVKLEQTSKDLTQAQTERDKANQKIDGDKDNIQTLESTKSELEQTVIDYKAEVEKLMEDNSNLENEVKTFKSCPGARRVFCVNYEMTVSLKP